MRSQGQTSNSSSNLNDPTHGEFCSPLTLHVITDNAEAARLGQSSLSDEELTQVRTLGPDTHSLALPRARLTTPDSPFRGVKAKHAFFATDKDNSGAIDKEELAIMIKSLGQTPNKKMIDEIMARHRLPATQPHLTPRTSCATPR